MIPQKFKVLTSYPAESERLQEAANAVGIGWANSRDNKIDLTPKHTNQPGLGFDLEEKIIVYWTCKGNFENSTEPYEEITLPGAFAIFKQLAEEQAVNVADAIIEGVKQAGGQADYSCCVCDTPHNVGKNFVAKSFMFCGSCKDEYTRPTKDGEIVRESTQLQFKIDVLEDKVRDQTTELEQKKRLITDLTDELDDQTQEADGWANKYKETDKRLATLYDQLRVIGTGLNEIGIELQRKGM